MGCRGDTNIQKLQCQRTVNGCELKLLERQLFQNELKVRGNRGHMEEREIRIGLRYGSFPGRTRYKRNAVGVVLRHSLTHAVKFSYINASALSHTHTTPKTRITSLMRVFFSRKTRQTLSVAVSSIIL